jgi:hypothetical protein
MLWYHLLHVLLLAEAKSQVSSTTADKASSVCTHLHIRLGETDTMIQIQHHTAEIASIALSEIPLSVRAFSGQPLFFGTPCHSP